MLKIVIAALLAAAPVAAQGYGERLPQHEGIDFVLPDRLRFDPVSGRKVLIALDPAATPFRGPVQGEAASTAFEPLRGSCPAAATGPGSVEIVLPPFGSTVCEAR